MIISGTNPFAGHIGESVLPKYPHNSNTFNDPHYSTMFHLPLSDSTVSKDAGIEPRTVVTSALAIRRSNH
jgi:hypothetical protein